MVNVGKYTYHTQILWEMVPPPKKKGERMKKNKKSPRDFDEITEVVRSDLKIVRDLNNKKGGVSTGISPIKIGI